MTTERFDIEVRDSVAKSIRTEITAIGSAARSTHTLVQQLNRELTASTRAALGSAQTAAAQATAAAGNSAAAQARNTAETARATIAQTRLTNEQIKGGLAIEKLAQAEAKTALAKQRVATEAARTEAAQSKANIAYLAEEAALNRAVLAEQRAIQSKEKLVAVSAQAEAAAQKQTVIHDRNTVVPSTSGALGGTGGSRSLVSAQTDTTRGGTAGVEENTLALGANAAAADRAAGAQSGYAARTAAVGNASRLTSQHSMNLAFQLNDIFVSLASGQKPMMVAIQQGAQIAQINQQTGLSWKQMGGEMLIMLRILERTTDAEAAAELAAAALAARNLTASAAVAAANVVQADTEIALALAQRESATTATQAAAAEARLAAAHEAAAIAASEQAVAESALSVAQGRQEVASANASKATVTRLGSVGRAALPVAIVMAIAAASVAGLTREANQGASGLKKYTEEMGYTAKEVKKLNAVTVTFGDTAKAVFQVGLKRILGAFGLDVQAMANGWNSALNWMARVARATMGGTYALVAGTADAMAKIWHAGASGNANGISLADLGKSYTDAYGNATRFMDDVVKQARTNAREGQDEMAKDMYNKPSSKKTKDKAGWDRAKELREANSELDNQIGMLGKYGDALERAQQIEQIGRTFREHNAPLTAAETKVLEDKIKALQEGKRVQEAMTAAEEAANGPARKHEATVEALNRLLEAGSISQAEYNRQLKMSERAFEDATNPLADMNRELEKNAGLVSHFGKSRDLKEYVEQMRQAAEAQGRSIYEPGKDAGTNADGDIVATGSRKYTPEVQRMIEEYQRQQKTQEMTTAFERIDSRQNEDVGSSSYILDHHKEMYAEIQRLREEDVNNEEEANRRKRDLDFAYGTAKMENTKSMFSGLASLQTSKNRELAAIGKAAAIAEATIDGILAVQKALKGPPGPPWSYAIAATTGVAAAVNVAKIAGVGFQTGGYTGDGPVNERAGDVHGKEYVFDAAATARIGVPALDAMRKGSVLSQPTARPTYSRANIRVVQGPGVVAEASERSDGEIEVIAERVVRRSAPRAVADNLRRGANSEVSSAFKTGYGLVRADR